MKKNNKILFLLSILLVVSCATSPENYRPETYREDVSLYQPYKGERFPANILAECSDSIRTFFQEEGTGNNAPLKSITEAMAHNPTRYPKGFEGVQGAHIQYGFESEYLHEETEALLKAYMPAPAFYSGSKEEWLKMSANKRLMIFDELVDDDDHLEAGSKFFEYRSKGHLIKITDDPELSAALPDAFVYDAGHFEIVLDPLDSAEAMIQKIKVINKNFGVGSMQATISNPLNKALLKSSAPARQELKEELLGYYNFMNDFDTLSKLGSGYERYLKDPNIQAVKSFNHPWLGPMTKLKHDKLEDLVEGIVDGKEYSEEELKQMSYLVVSHKFIGGLSFRPDVAYKKNRLASEVRDCHQNVKCIEDRIIRETYFLMKGKEPFKKFSELEQFDTVKNFKDIRPDEIKYMLKSIFPTYSGFSQKELELYRNFSYPYRDWSKHVQMLDQPGLKNQIADAQQAYTVALEKITVDYNAKLITKEQAQTKVMGALAEFSKKSGLVDAMKAKYDHLINPEEIKSFDILKFTMFLRNLKLTGESFTLVG